MGGHTGFGDHTGNPELSENRVSQGRASGVEYLVMIGNEVQFLGNAPGPQKSRKGRGEELCGEIGSLPTQFWNGN